MAVYGLTGTLPTQMLTIVNQPSSFNITNKTLSEAIETLAGTPYADANGNFVMSTSVYGGGNPFASVNCTALAPENFALEPIDVNDDYGTNGSATPVEVYVERLAAKVGVSLDSNIGFATGTGVLNHNLISIDNLTDEFAEPLPQLQGMNGYYVQIQGWNVDGVARDAYMSKHIDTGWNTTFTWNASSSYRSYWADSPNYGVEHTYPTTNYNSTTGTANTDDTESTTPLDEYLRYVSLASTIDFGATTYCGENTNTVAILGDATSTGLTNIIVKAQLLAWNPNYTSGTGVDIVKYGDYLYAVEVFCQERVDAVDFVGIIDDAIDALPNGEYSESDLTALKTAAANGSLYKTSSSTTSPTADDITLFGGEMLSLYNAYDGNVKIGYNTSSTTTDDIVYSGSDIDSYYFWYSVDASALTGAIDELTNAGLLVSIDDDYYIPLSADITLTGQDNTMRSYFLSALAADAQTTNTQFANSSYPNYYKDGLMYYHVPIEHLGSAGTNGALTEGEYGVVRNHWYDISVTSISSFGRGIAVEDEVIVPISENETQTTSIGASTKIYSWKEYDQTVIF